METLLANFHFLRPIWLLAGVAAAAVCYLVIRQLAGASPWRKVIDPELASVLIEDDPSDGKRRGWLPALALVLLGIALAGPTWQRLPQPVERSLDALFIVLDLSLSMYAQDVAPSRLVRARHKVADLLRERSDGYTALIAYAGDAHAVAPLTDDIGTIENLLGSLEPGMMPVFGSNVDRALTRVHDMIQNAGVESSRIVLITDGIDRISDVTSHRDRNHPISVLAVGTRDGAPIPLDFAGQAGRFLQNDAGTTITPQLDEPKLKEVAELSYGRFTTLQAGPSDVRLLLDTPLPIETGSEEVDRQFDVWQDAGFWLLIPVLLLLLPGFRSIRGSAPTALLVLVVFVPAPAEASLWDDLWQRRDQQAHDALVRGAPERAETLFENPDWRGVARYRSDDFAGAAELFDRNPSADGHYNRGTALAKAGELTDALEALEEALALAPDHADAAHNRDIVEKLLEQQSSSSSSDPSQNSNSGSESEQGQQDQSQSSPESEASQDQAENSQSEEEQQDQGNRKDSTEQNEPERGEPEDEEVAMAERDADAEADEQWLRRVPDDPGGLLRRKFQHETNQRLKRGDYAARESDRIW